MSASLADRLRRLGWARDRRGATAIEMAIVAPIFIFMIFALIQVALYFLVQVTLDNATAMAARELRTGYDAQGNAVVADGASDTAGQKAFSSYICSNMNWLQSWCSSNSTLVVDVRPLGAFATTPAGPNIAADGSSTGGCFYSGSAGSAVILRSYFRWPLPVAALRSTLQSNSNGVVEVKSSEVFQVEPNGQSNSSTTSC